MFHRLLTLLIILITLLVALAENNSHEKNANERIVNGEGVVKGEFPYFAFIFTVGANNLGSWCGGGLISPKIVITAAHCFRENEPVKEIRVYMNKDQKFSASNGDYVIGKAIIHPAFHKSGSLVQNDIAVVKLSKPFAVTSFLKLPTSEVKPGTLAVVPGAGQTSPSINRVGNLLKKNLVTGIVRHGIIEVPVSLENGLVCKGDSGSPLVVKGSTPSEDTLVGIASYITHSCKKNGEEGYTSVYAFLKWIKENSSSKWFG